MRATLSVLLTALSTVLPASAVAADVTDIAPNLRGDVRLVYRGALERAGLEEAGEVVGLRATTAHGLDTDIQFSVYQGIAVRIALPATLTQTIAFPAARTMVVDPVDGGGSMVGGLDLDAPDVKSSGLQGVWLGLGLAPFREDYRSGLPVNARFDIAVRTPGPKATLYGDKRGAAPGGAAIHLAGAFSVTRGVASPYTSLSWTAELPAAKGQVTTLDGVDRGRMELSGASRLDAVAGAELEVARNDARQMRVAIDLHGSIGYRGPSNVGSGFWLPDTLESGKGLPATESEYILAGAGVGLVADVNRFVGVRFGADGFWASPHRVEHLYAVRTDAQSWRMGWSVGVVGRIRTNEDRR